MVYGGIGLLLLLGLGYILYRRKQEMQAAQDAQAAQAQIEASNVYTLSGPDWLGGPLPPPVGAVNQQTFNGQAGPLSPVPQGNSPSPIGGGNAAPSYRQVPAQNVSNYPTIQRAPSGGGAVVPVQLIGV
jgi:LPXTG-motif cell wall-anchored protein